VLETETIQDIVCGSNQDLDGYLAPIFWCYLLIFGMSLISLTYDIDDISILENMA